MDRHPGRNHDIRKYFPQRRSYRDGRGRRAAIPPRKGCLWEEPRGPARAPDVSGSEACSFHSQGGPHQRHAQSTSHPVASLMVSKEEGARRLFFEEHLWADLRFFEWMTRWWHSGGPLSGPRQDGGGRPAMLNACMPAGPPVQRARGPAVDDAFGPHVLHGLFAFTSQSISAWALTLRLGGTAVDCIAKRLFMALVLGGDSLNLSRGRHLLTVLSCCIFAAARLVDADRSFTEIIRAIQGERMAVHGEGGALGEWYRAIKVESGAAGGAAAVDLVSFYNGLFLPRMRAAILSIPLSCSACRPKSREEACLAPRPAGLELLVLGREERRATFGRDSRIALYRMRGGGRSVPAAGGGRRIVLLGHFGARRL